MLNAFRWWHDGFCQAPGEYDCVTIQILWPRLFPRSFGFDQQVLLALWLTIWSAHEPKQVCGWRNRMSIMWPGRCQTTKRSAAWRGRCTKLQWGQNRQFRRPPIGEKKWPRWSKRGGGLTAICQETFKLESLDQKSFENRRPSLSVMSHLTDLNSNLLNESFAHAFLPLFVAQSHVLCCLLS